jgi:endoglucanase
MNRPSFSLMLVLALISACSVPAAAPTPTAPVKLTPLPTYTPRATATQAKAAIAKDLSKTTAGTIDPFEFADQLGRGVNFGNALEAPNEGEWGMTLEEGFFDLVKQGGFRSIRLPTKWSAHALADAPYTVDPAFFERVDWAIDNATRRGLNIVVNMHHYEELMADTDKHRARFAAIWRQIAERYRDRPANLAFELCNEPVIPAGLWNKVYLEALAEVRKSNPTRIVVIGGVDWNSVNGLTQLVLPDNDRNIVATFHYYSPAQFTHQGAGWVNGAEAWLGTTWEGRGPDRVGIDFDIEKAYAWGIKNKRPLWMGEFGAYSKADMASRERWTTYVAREAERRRIAWAYWEFGAGFGVYDRAAKAWVPEIKRALIPAQ